VSAAVSVAERLALLEIYAELAATIDGGDAAGWADLFTEDGVLRTSRGRELRGREELARFAAEWFGSSSSPRRHMSWHHRFEPVGEEILGSCYAALLRTGPDAVTIEFTASYRDRFSRRGDGWLLRERDVAIDVGNQEGE
jgi:ketosteroid isomerase-like protein